MEKLNTYRIVWILVLFPRYVGNLYNPPLSVSFDISALTTENRQIVKELKKNKQTHILEITTKRDLIDAFQKKDNCQIFLRKCGRQRTSNRLSKSTIRTKYANALMTASYVFIVFAHFIVGI